MAEPTRSILAGPKTGPKVRAFRFDARHLDPKPMPDTLVTFRPGVYWMVAEWWHDAAAPNALNVRLRAIDGHDLPATAQVRELPLPIREVLA